MAAVDDPKSLGRSRLPFASSADIDEFVEHLGRFERGEMELRSGDRSGSCVEPTASARRTTLRCCG